MEKDILLIDNSYSLEEDVDLEAVGGIINDFVVDYANHQDEPLDEWLHGKIRASLPEKSNDEINAIVVDIISSIEDAESRRNSLEDALSSGRSKESWFADEFQKATSRVSMQESVNYLSRLDNALREANRTMLNTITNQNGTISQNPQLDGFIAEQHHVQTFNLAAEAKGSQYRAKVLEPDGSGYTKNSVDIEIIDAKGKVVKRYQSKYCKDSAATEKAFEHGDYRGQQKLIPEDQEIPKKSTRYIESPDGVRSEPLTKQRAQQLRDEAQSGNWQEVNWNAYKTKDLAVGVAKQARKAALIAAAVGAGVDIARKMYHGEEIKTKEVVKVAIESGKDVGIKTAIAGAIKVGAEKGVIKCIPKGTPAGQIANVVFVAVDNVKVLYKMGKGEISVAEGLSKVEEITVSAVAGLAASAKGASAGALVGAKVGAFFGPEGIPVGVAIGGLIGGMAAYMAGAKVGEKVVEGRRYITKKAKTLLESDRETEHTLEYQYRYA